MVDGTVWDVLYYDRGVYHMVVMWDDPSNSRFVGFDSGGATHDVAMWRLILRRQVMPDSGRCCACCSIEGRATMVGGVVVRDAISF